MKLNDSKLDPTTLNIDLHCHSSVSDGILAPAEVARRAHAQGVQVWALTDHDEVSGQAAAAAAARDLGMMYVPGVEVSITWANETIHMVGLRIDPDNAALKQGLHNTRYGRAGRARAMALQLEGVGIHGAFEGALAYAGNPELIGRTHFARFLVEQKICTDVREVFTRYLVAGKPGYVPMRWARLTDAVEWIRGAGGVAVIAHPGRYKISDLLLRALFDEFREAGGAAIEVVTGSHTVDQYKKFALYAKEYGFLASRGSDFHGPGESHIELGRLPPLPDSVVPVWHDWFN